MFHRHLSCLLLLIRSFFLWSINVFLRLLKAVDFVAVFVVVVIVVVVIVVVVIVVVVVNVLVVSLLVVTCHIILSCGHEGCC